MTSYYLSPSIVITTSHSPYSVATTRSILTMVYCGNNRSAGISTKKISVLNFWNYSWARILGPSVWDTWNSLWKFFFTLSIVYISVKLCWTLSIVYTSIKVYGNTDNRQGPERKTLSQIAVYHRQRYTGINLQATDLNNQDFSLF
jgi:hypothetical protein